MKIKLLIADVDGTLVTRTKLLTPRALDALARMRRAGVLFAVTSGRPPRGLAKLVAQLNLTTAVAAFNGGVYVKPDLTTVLAQRTIAPEVARYPVDHLLLTQTTRLGVEAWKQLFDDYLRVRAQTGHQRFVPFDVVEDYDHHIRGRAPRAAIRSFLDARIELPDDDELAAATAPAEMSW